MREFTKEHREKLAAAQTGRKLSEETKQKIARAHIGLPAWNKGIPNSEETRQKIAEAATGRPNFKRRKQFCSNGHDTHKVGRQKNSAGVAGSCRMCQCTAGAKARRVPFNLTEDQFVEIITKECIWKCSECNATGIDQIVAGLGYIVGNIQPMCGNHNKLKWDWTITKLAILCSSVR